MSKKICFFSGDISRTGGTERAAVVIANALARRGFTVSILSQARGEAAAFNIDGDVRLFSLHGEARSSNFSNIETIKRLRKFIGSNKIDYIVDVDILLSFYSILASIGMITKVISWEHFNHFVNVGDFAQRTKRTVARTLAARYSAHIVTLTAQDRFSYLGAHNCRAIVVAISNPMLRNNKGLAALRSKNVISVGRLVGQKGFDLLLAAWQLVNRERSDWVLKIVGSGDEEIKLKTLATVLKLGNSVQFIRHTKEIDRQYLNSSIYVMSSRFEGFPMVLLEAKSFGLPVVSFDCDTGAREIVRNDVDGILVERENSAMLALGLLELINNDAKRFAFGARACEDNRFELDKITSLWEDVLS